MTDELKPCPFCGEEHVSVSYTGYEDEGCVLYTLGCSTTNCPGHISGSWRYFNLERAAEAWNRRAERTCRWKHIEGTWFMSECGERYDRVIPDNYCPNCGAKVIDHER